MKKEKPMSKIRLVMRKAELRKNVSYFRFTIWKTTSSTL
jgi:hypothetical protein